MINCIITPTFIGHFKYITNYLNSFQKFSIRKDNFEICFTISRVEAKKFKKITEKFNTLKIKTLFFEDILSYFNIELTPNELLEIYGKYSFQTLKKFYTMLYLGSEYRFLVLDSESILFRYYDINCLFEDYFKNPYISGTNIKYRYTDSVIRGVKRNTSILLNKESNIWFLENFVWFYDFNILNDMFEKYGAPIQMVESIHQNKKSFNEIFEIDLYHTYIYNNINKYNYHFIDVDKELAKIPNNKKYKEEFQKKFNGGCGLLEHIMLFLNNNNIKEFGNILKNINFNIIRCDNTTIENYMLQKKFLEIVQPVILAASQEHAFGINSVFTTLVKTTKSYTKLCKHFYRWYNPLKNLCSTYIIEPLQTIVHLFPFAVDVLKIIWILYIKRKK